MLSFQNALAAFLSHAHNVCQANIDSQGFKWACPTFEVTTGKKYAKVWNVDHNGHRSIHCFVTLENGDILKAATYKAPAKHARGNIFDDDNGLQALTPHGVRYLR